MPSLKTLWVYGKESQLPILRAIGDAKEPVGAVLIEGLSDDIGQLIERTINQKHPGCLVRTRVDIQGPDQFAKWIHSAENTKSVNGLYCVKQKVPDAQVLKVMSSSEKADLMKKSLVAQVVQTEDQTVMSPIPAEDFLDGDDDTDVNVNAPSSNRVVHALTSFGLRYSIINDPNLKFNLPKQNVPLCDSLNQLSPQVYFQADDVLAYAETKKFALVNAVNTQGVMGAGMALQFKNAMPPEYFADYQNYCQWFKSNKPKVAGFGFCHLMIINGLYVFGLPTKIGLKDKLDIELYKAGLRSLLHLLMEVEEYTHVQPFVLIPKGLGNGLARPNGMNEVSCNTLLEKATAEVVEQCGGILNVEKLLWLGELDSKLMPTNLTRVINISMHVKMLRDTFKFNVPEEFTSSWKIGRFDLVNCLGGQYLVVEPSSQAHSMGVNYWNNEYGIPEIEWQELYGPMIGLTAPRSHLGDFELEALQILKWARWLKQNPKEKLVVMTKRFGNYRWLMADDGMVSGYGCRSLLAHHIGIYVINKLWAELREVKDRIWFTFDTYWTNEIVKGLLDQNRTEWVDNQPESFKIRNAGYLYNLYQTNDGSTEARLEQLRRNGITRPMVVDVVSDIAYKMQFQDLYYMGGESNWRSGACWLSLVAWYRSQKDFVEVKSFNSKWLSRKRYTL